jgi:hypothetical protein
MHESWADNFFILGSNEEVRIVINQIEQYFECDEGGEVKEYIGCQLVQDNNKVGIKFTRPVIIKSCKDEFKVNVLVV